MPSDFGLKFMNTAHRAALAVSRGRIGWRADNMPVLRLTTTGRKSGLARSVLLTSPLRLGPTFVVVASRGGDDVHPAWFLNLTANPEVEVTAEGGPRQRMLARVATADERAELWPKVIADHRQYAQYQTKTEREIPLVLLAPQE
jgi:deazaflavin-dependent oxidoreductase (nitroreductase family)